MATPQDFVTVTHDQYSWPFPKPIVGRPCEPPRRDIQPHALAPPVAAYCHCDVHGYQPKVEQYKALVDKEQRLCKEYKQLRKQMVDVSNDILDHPCDDSDKKMATIYQLSFSKKAFPLTDYMALREAADSAAPVPRDKSRLGVLRCYKDPTHFAHTHMPIVRPTVDPPPEVHKGVMPDSVMQFFAVYPGRSEYMDTYCTSAVNCWRATQRFKEPMPSARRREDSSCT